MEPQNISSLTTTDALSLFETTKEQRRDFVSRITDAVASGEISPLKAHLQVKAMEDIISRLTVTDEKKNENAVHAKAYRKALLDEADQYGKTFSLHNAKFDVKEVGTKYDYTNCNDPELIDLALRAEAANEALKARQKYLQNVPLSGVTIVNEDTGETYTIYPPVKTSTTSVTVSLK